ncbi:MAG: hypothetical protein LPK45_02130 [Bacteroidota bacterium]|nr:hypothetical protein [Bacteroidota bacterium]MDX5429832.1 hypothetical protein [Bacteroidota bacterium]MDX5468611.1 hypothetical protein [Bacteroidota bacterium]
MKLLNKLLLFSLVLTVATSCTKLQESPEPGAGSNNNTGGGTGGGNTGNPDVYIGLWKLTAKTANGNDVFDANNTFTVKLDVAATATWTYTIFGIEQTPISDSYILNTSSTPKTIVFTDAGTRTVTNKTGSIIQWEYQDPNLNALVSETLTKQ